MNRITKAIEHLGVELKWGKKTGKAVIYPVRYTQRTEGGVTEDINGLHDPHRYFIFASGGLLDGIRCGEKVSSGSDEYYILWTDRICLPQGLYIKACARVAEGKER